MPGEIAADLHVHTTVSDGTQTLETRIKQASERELLAIAITDHDRIPAALGPGSERYNGVEVVTGVEVRADLFETKVELLGYYVDPDNPTLSDVLEKARAYRRERNRELVAQLNTSTDLELEYEELAAEVRGGLGRPHIASTLLERGYVDSINEAFTEYLAEEGSCFVPMRRIPTSDVIDAIHAAGGIASLAHPGRIRSERVPDMVATATDAGLDAIETWYPYDNGASFRTAEADRLAEKHGLKRTGGSDCHGDGSGKFRLGTTGMSAGAFERLTAPRR